MELAAKAPTWLARVLLPQLNEVRGDIRALDGKLTGRIDGLEGKIGGLEAKMDAEFRSVHSEIKRLDERVDGLDKRMALAQRLTTVEAKVRDLEVKH